MALLFMDSFDHYATADITEKWTQIHIADRASSGMNSPVIGAYGRNSSQAIRLQPNISAALCTQSLSRPLGMTVVPADNVCIVGLAVKYSDFSNISVRPCGKICAAEWYTASEGSNFLVACRNINDKLWFARVNTDGTISVLRDDGTTACTVLGSTSNSIQAGVWAYVEFKVTIHGSTATIDVRINGTSGLSLTGQNTRGMGASNTWNNILVGYATYESTTVSKNIDVDDLVVMDSSGSFNNAFIGDVTISVLNPNGAGNSTDWTPSAGSNYECVDEDVVNDDTDYVSSSTLNAKDLYAMEDCAAGADIRAVQVVTAMRKGTEGPGKIKHVIRSSSTDYDSAEISLGGTAYSFNRTIWETDPATAAAWTESGWNAAQVGVKKTG
jgi:hypothetical protein